MAISETLALVDRVTAPANKMAGAMGKLAAETNKAQRALNASGKSGAALAKTDRAAKMTSKSMTGLGKATASTQKEAKKLDEKDALGAIGLGGAIGSGILTAAAGLAIMGKMIGVAAGLAKDLAISFTESLVEAKLTRDAAKSLQDTLSNGRGEQVLALISTQAQETGQSIAELRKQTVAARDAGVSYKDSFKLGNIRGDILATGRSAEEADAAINQMLGEVKSGSKTAAQGMDELKTKFRVAGDGMKAAEKASTTFGGALTKLKNAGTIAFDEIAKRAGPKMDELGTKIGQAFDKFTKGGEAAAIIDKIVAGVNFLIEVAMIAVELFGPLWDGFKQGLAPLQPIIDSVGEALAEAFGEDKASTMSTLAKAAQVLGAALGAVVGVAVLGAGAIIAVGAAIGGVMALPAMLGAKLYSLGAAALAAGSALINGLVQGIKDGMGRALAAAQELADAVKAKIKGALKIGSPSKVFAEFGGNVATGFAQGISGGIGEAEKAGGQMAAAPMASAAAAPGKSASGGGGGGSPFTLQLNVSAGPGATAADGEALASGIVPVIQREIASFFEGQLLEAGA